MAFKHVFYAFLLVACSSASWAQDKQLQELKAKNNLEDWLYARIDRAYNSPLQQLPLLMSTQKEAWRQPVTIGERTAWIWLFCNQGYYQLQAGDILTSIQCYENAYTSYRQYKLPDFDLVEYVLKPLSNNYTRLGDYERAISVQQNAIGLLRQQGNEDVAPAYCNLAISYFSMGDYGAARQTIISGLKIVNDAETRFRLNNILADILVDEDDLAGAQKLAASNLKLRTSKNIEPLLQVGAYTTAGRIELKLNQPAAAANHFRQALLLLNRHYANSKTREKANQYAKLGTALRLSGNTVDAQRNFDRALELLRVKPASGQKLPGNIYGENILVDVFYQQALLRKAAGDNTASLRNIRYALFATDKIRNEFADNKTKERLQREAKSMAEMAIGTAFDLYQQTREQVYLNEILEIAEQTKSRTLNDQIYENSQKMTAKGKDPLLRKQLDLERAISYHERQMITDAGPADHTPKMAAIQKKIGDLKFELAMLKKQHRVPAPVTNFDVAQQLSGLPVNLHVIEFFLGQNDLYVIHIRNRKVSDVQKISNAAAIKSQVVNFVKTYYRDGPRAMLELPKSFYTASFEIFEKLLAPAVIKTGEQICIIPDDVLGYLSFDGLITTTNYTPAITNWPFLIKKIRINYKFSLSTIRRTINTERNTLYGLFITHQKNSKPILAVEKEASEIARRVKGRYWYNEQVNTRSFFDAFNRATALHISTHAYLSGPGQEPTLDLGKQKLFLFELQAQTERPDLVVLSACRTGDGMMAQGEGIISLSRGFSAIGTPATIAGLWNVNDGAVSQITADLYSYLLDGETTGTALHRAKLDWLSREQSTDAMYLPYYWDSLILMGSDEQVALERTGRFNVFYVVGILTIIGLLMALFRSGKRRA